MKNMKKIPVTTSVLLLFFLALPLVSFAAFENTQDLIINALYLLTLLTRLAAAAALLFFFWGLALLILRAGNEEKRKEGKKVMLWGIIALFIIVSIWGITEYIQDALSINRYTLPPVLCIPGTQNC